MNVSRGTASMDIAEVFRRLGFGKHASQVYEVALESRTPMLVAHIARKASVARAQAYRNIEELLRAGLLKKARLGKRTGYVAESPQQVERLFASVERKAEAALERRLKKQKRELPEQLRYFSGFSGIRAVFDDVIAHTPRGQTFYRYTSERSVQKTDVYLSPGYRKHRDVKKLERLVISNPGLTKQKRPRLERFIKHLTKDEGAFEQDIIQFVYGNRVAFMNIAREEAYIIEDKSLAEFQKVIFKQLYRKL